MYVASKIRRTQTQNPLRQLKEYEQFELRVSTSEKSGIPPYACITCTMCDKHLSLSMGCKYGSFSISNWSRHVKGCILKKQQKASTRTGGGELTSVQVDWSRTSRKQLSLLKSECDQTKVTEHFALLDEVKNVMQKDPELHKVVTNVDIQRKKFLPNDCESNFCPFFKQLLANAFHNANKIPTSQRHDTIIKKFATSLLTL